MYADMLPYLACPICSSSPLALIESEEEDGEIVKGVLHCALCSMQTQIREGIWDALDGDALPWTPAQITNYTPIAARLYEPTWRWQALSIMSGRRFPLREELTLLHDLIAPRAGNFYVDVACSVGLYARTIARSGATVAGVDHSWAMLREARRVAREQGLRVSYVRARAQSLPFADRAATGTLMGGSLNEIGDQIGALREIARVMDMDGRFFCMNLLQAQSGWGRALQRVLATGGIDFPDLITCNRWFEAADLRRLAQWRWRVVAITLLQRVPVAEISDARI